MTIITICPLCSVPSLSVNKEVLCHFLNKNVKQNIWHACVNPKCKVAYYSDRKILNINRLKYPLWYKTKSKNSPICYCSKLTRNDIRNAVRDGTTTFQQVQKITGKNRTGYCRNENPLGKCCKEIFIFEVEKAKKALTTTSN